MIGHALLTRHGRSYPFAMGGCGMCWGEQAGGELEEEGGGTVISV